MSAIQDTKTIALRDFLRADKDQYRTLRSIFHGFFTQKQAGSGFHEITEAQMQRSFKEAEAIRIAASKRTITTDEVRKLHYAEAFKAAHDLDGICFNRPTDTEAQAQATRRFEELCALHGISKKKDLATWVASKEGRATLQRASKEAEQAYAGLR